jgi:hypothetical protein
VRSEKINRRGNFLKKKRRKGKALMQRSKKEYTERVDEAYLSLVCFVACFTGVRTIFFLKEDFLKYLKILNLLDVSRLVSNK